MVAALALVGVATGCGNVTSGGYGDVEVVMSSEQVDESGSEITPSVLAAVLEATGSETLGIGELTDLQGTLRVSVRSFARRRDGDFHELTDGVQQITLPLGDPSPLEIARRPVPAGQYDAVRTFFGRIEATITGGLILDGQPFLGTIRVNLGPDGFFSIVDETGFEVVEDQPTRIALEMQSRIWLRLADAVRQEVDLSDFRQVFRVRVRRLLAG